MFLARTAAQRLPARLNRAAARRFSRITRVSSRNFSTPVAARQVNRTTETFSASGGATALSFLAGACATAYVFAADGQENTAEAAATDASAAGASLERRVADLEVALAGKTNSAFVFIKPHACNDKVKGMLRAHLAKNNIRITGEGTLAAEQIDRELLIDTHYGAIASKAVKLKPSELNVPAKGKAGFEKMFGLTWEDAIASGKVYNAKDACAVLGVDGAGLDAKWATLTRGENLIKFGGGFYCGQVDGIFVMNGFYMSMRSAYTTPPAKIHYFTVQWPTDMLSWESFRGDVLGATNPKEAAPGSARRIIFDQYQNLGLDSVPNTGDNGVHASASPFEALAERANWLKAPIAADDFGRGLIAAGVDEETIRTWASDPQVTFNGEKGSLFDFLEDLDADAVLERATQIQ